MGSNPTPRTLSSTPCSGTRHIQKIEPNVLSQILQLAFWMRKTGYRNSTTQTCVRALKGLARRTNLLEPESVKSYLANAQLSENRKTKLLEDVPRFYGHLKIPFNRPRYKRIETSKAQNVGGTEETHCRILWESEPLSRFSEYDQVTHITRNVGGDEETATVIVHAANLG